MKPGDFPYFCMFTRGYSIDFSKSGLNYLQMAARFRLVNSYNSTRLMVTNSDE